MINQLKSYRNGVHGGFFLAVAAELERLQKENEQLSLDVCGECDPANYGWIFNRVEGKAACGCMLEAEPFQILLKALDKLARLGNGDRFGNSEGNCIAIDALRAVLPLEYGNLV